MRVTKLVFVSIVLLYDVYTVSADPQTHMFVMVKTRDDSVEDEPVIKKVYDSALNLLVYKMKTWMKSVADDRSPDPVEKISKYLGFPDETIRVIDDAFTELVYRHVITQEISINNLGAAFLYSCDIGRMRGRDANRVENVRENFEMIFENLGIAAGSDDYAAMDVHGEEDALVKDLRESVAAIGKSVDRWLRASIGMVKNRLFVDPSANPTVNHLQHRFLDDYRRDSAASYETETNVLVAMMNHVQILRKVIPDLFGFAYDHVVLLTELRKFDIRDLDDSEFLRSTEVLPLVVTIFLNRYFELHKPGDHLLFRRDIFRFLDFFDPSREYLARQVSIGEYKNKGENDDFDIRVWRATDLGILRMLRAFSDEDPETWNENRTIKIEFNEDATLDRDRILALMAENTRNAVEFLAEIKRKCGLYGGGEYARLRESIAVPQGPKQEQK